MDKKIVVVKHAENEGPGTIGTFFEDHGWPVEVIELGKGEVLPNEFDGIAAVIMLGGPMNVYEEDTYPFLKDEDLFITRLLIEEIPFLGICLGAQLLAKTCNARVEKAPAREIGWFDVELSGEGRKDPLFKGLSRKITVFQWHEDTFAIPNKGVLLAHGAVCAHQAFRVGDNAYGFQFHIEVTEDMVREWSAGFAIETGARTATLKSHRDRMKACGTEVQLIMSNFLHIIESSVRVRNLVRQFVDEEQRSRRKKSIMWWKTGEYPLTISTKA